MSTKDAMYNMLNILTLLCVMCEHFRENEY